MEQQTDILDDIQTAPGARRKLLPWWIKIFIWIFIIFGVFSPIGLVFGIFGFQFNQALYGLETNDPFSATGLVILTIFTLKGIVAYGLWFEKRWAVQLGIGDAILGFSICSFVMLYPVLTGTGANINFRLEIILLIPYLVFLVKSKGVWLSLSVLKPIDATIKSHRKLAP